MRAARTNKSSRRNMQKHAETFRNVFPRPRDKIAELEVVAGAGMQMLDELCSLRGARGEK